MALPTETQIIDNLKNVLDPELHIDVVNLGLIYGVNRDEKKNHVHVQLGLTSPACPYAPELQRQVEETVAKMEGVQTSAVEITLSPPWDPRTMASDEAKDMLGIF
ncbi:MAG: DUF59 domain-containing protein [Deltaproteobacteria bacterium]|nr:DUF59 domain-containing protein [Deltaproteobacteria bacterium]